MRYLIYIFIIFTVILENRLYSQERGIIIVDIPSNQKPWSSSELNTNNYQFAIVTDRTGGHRPGVFMEGIRRLNLLQPEFVMSVGDLIEGYTEDTDVLDTEWNEFNGFIDSLQMPFFYVPGNHDITNQVMEDKWKELYGVTYYHFVYNEVLFLCLNSEDNKRGAGRGTIDDAQYEYIKKTLEENADVKWTLVFLHQPLWVQDDTKRWKDVEALLKERNHNVFAGHYHRYWKSNRNNGKYIALATTGGGSRLRGTAYGEFDHVVWVTMTEEGPILANLLLEGVWDENVVTGELVELVRNRPYPISQEPVFVQNGKVSSLTTSLKVTNDSDYPMQVKIDGLVNADQQYDLTRSEFMVEPNSVEQITINIMNASNTDLVGCDPIRLKTEVSYQYPGRPDIVLQEELRVAPVAQYSVTEANRKITLDGNLKEWQGEGYSFGGERMSGKPFDYRGPEDLTVEFQTRYDDEFLYIAFDIADDELVINDEGPIWNQDALLVGLDGRPAGVSAHNNGQDRNGQWLGYIQAFREKDAVYQADGLPTEVKTAYKKTEDGVTVELAVPLSYLEKMQNGNWKEFRLAVGYYDFDDNGESRTEHYWFYPWGSEGSIVGEGTFFR